MSKRAYSLTGILLIAALLIAPAAAFAKDAFLVEGNLTGTVFYDANQDGVFDASEAGIPGVSINVTGPNDFDETVLTDANGEFGFTLVDAGDYTVTETNLAGYASTTDDVVPVSFDGTKPPDPAVIEFGDYAAGSISGVVFDDLNRDRSLDAGDAPLTGVTVELFDGEGFVADATTDTDGAYAFSELPLGSYSVVETDPEGYYSTTPNVVELELVVAGDAASVNFGDFMPEEGEVSDHELLLWEYFDVLMVDVLHLRDHLDWGYGNIARALFLVQMSETTLEEIIALRGGDGEMHGWGNILRSILGHPSLKRHNWGLIVSGRAAPEGGLGIAQASEACGLEAEIYAEYLATYGPGKVKGACRLADKYAVPAENIFSMLGSGMSFGQIKQALKAAPDALETPPAEEGDEGDGNGPPPCKGWRKDDPGC